MQGCDVTVTGGNGGSHFVNEAYAKGGVGGHGVVGAVTFGSGSLTATGGAGGKADYYNTYSSSGLPFASTLTNNSGAYIIAVDGTGAEKYRFTEKILNGADVGNQVNGLTLRLIPISYVDASGAQQPPLSDYTPVKEDTVTWSDSWYAVISDVSFSSRITVSGKVNLILCDGVTLTASQGITVQGDDSLTIWAQSGGTGTLNATCSDSYRSGIGGLANSSAGTIVINGGNITATAGKQGAGIGGGSASNFNNIGGSGGVVTINGGTVTASSHFGAGIGGGSASSVKTNGGSGGVVTINGGTVTASSGRGEAIGRGYDDDKDAGSGELYIKKGMKVTDPANTYAEGRTAACRGSNVTITECDRHLINESHVCNLCGLFIIYGDLSGDKKVSTDDALMCLKAAVGIIKLNADQTKAADVNGDKKISTEDALLILRHAVGIIKKFPVE